jgi:hypothetical protein
VAFSLAVVPVGPTTNVSDDIVSSRLIPLIVCVHFWPGVTVAVLPAALARSEHPLESGGSTKSDVVPICQTVLLVIGMVIAWPAQVSTTELDAVGTHVPMKSWRFLPPSPVFPDDGLASPHPPDIRERTSAGSIHRP